MTEPESQIFLYPPMGHSTFIAQVTMADGTVRTTPPALTRGAARLTLAGCRAGLTPWHEDQELSAVLLDRLDAVGRWLLPDGEVAALLRAAWGEHTTVTLPGDPMSRDPALRSPIEVTGVHAIQALSRVRYQALRDAVDEVGVVAAERDRLGRCPLATGLRTTALWCELNSAIEGAAVRVAKAARLMSCDDGQLTSYRAVSDANGSTSINIDFNTETPSDWPDQMAARFASDLAMQARCLDFLDALDPSLEPIGPARRAHFHETGQC